MLNLSRKVDYALLALAHLARQETSPAGCISARCLAECYSLPRSLMANLLKQLQHAGLIASVRGASGGYVLACPPQCITLAQVLEAIEQGPAGLTRCCRETSRGSVPVEGEQACGACDVEGQCPIRDSIRDLNDQFRAILSSVTLHDLLERRVCQSVRVSLGADGDRDPPAALTVLR